MTAPVAAAIHVAPYDEALAPAHARFAARMWPTKRRRREEVYNRWKFRGPEHGAVPGLLLALSDGEVVGQTGALPAVLALDGDQVPCQWVCDIIVDPNVRRRGVATRLLEAAIARGIVTVASNASPAADFAMRRSGFQALEGPGMSVLPLDPSHVIGWKTPRALRAAIPAAAAALRPVFQWRARHLREERANGPAVSRGGWRDVAASVAAGQRVGTEPHIVHDETFLAWRCGGLPDYVDPLISLRTSDGSYAIVGPGAPFYYVFDWHASSRASFQALFAAAHALAVDAEALTLQAYGNSIEEREWLRSVGFLTLRRPVSILCHPPERFLPRHSRMRYSIFDSDGNL